MTVATTFDCKDGIVLQIELMFNLNQTKMKNLKTIMIAVLAAVMLVPFSSCKKENGNGGGDDNTGIMLRISNNYDYLYLLEKYSYDYKCHLTVSETNNFYVYNGEIASVGSVSSLSRIKKIPESGWVSEIAVQPGWGYVVRVKAQDGDYHYARVYVEDWIAGVGGGIIGAVLWYEDNWK